MKQARYRQGPTVLGEAHACAVYTSVPLEGPWHLLFNARHGMVYCLHPVPAYEFRRGFCTLVLFITLGAHAQRGLL